MVFKPKFPKKEIAPAPVEEEYEEEDEQEVPEPPRKPTAPPQEQRNPVTKEELIDMFEGHIARAMEIFQYIKRM